jgi:hypothetical protein
MIPDCDLSSVIVEGCIIPNSLTCTRVDSADGCLRTRKLIYTAKGCDGVECSDTQTITWIEDTTPPTITCPPDVEVNGGGECCVTVDLGTATATDNCDDEPTITNDAPEQFCVGTTVVTWTATDDCGNQVTCQQTVTVLGRICAHKFYDANADGDQDPGEPNIAGWKIVVRDEDGNILFTGYTDADGNVCFDVPAGTYTVEDVAPNTSWFSSTPSSYEVTIDAENCDESLTFGNYCLVPSGGRTLGFWFSRIGRSILFANDPGWRTLLNGYCLRNADGTPYTVPAGLFAGAYTSFRTWLLNATAVNMAYMLSAQMATMILNVAYGSVDGNSFDPCSGMTINALIAAANAALCADGFTPAGDPNRALQEFLKNCLDALNNGGNVIPPTPCPFDSPY